MNGPDRFEAYDGDEGENDHDEQADPRDGDGIRDVGALQHESGTRDENGTPDGDAENAPAPGGPDGSGSPQDSGGPDTPENPGSPGGSGRSDGLGGPGGPEDPEGTGGPGTPSSPESTRGPDEPGTPSSPESTGGPDAPESTGGLGRAVSGEGAERGRSARIPTPRVSVEDSGLPLPATGDLGDPPPPPAPPVFAHPVLKALLGAWALAACSAEEAAAVEEHLGACGSCADEARRLREAVGLLQRPESLDLDPGLRTRVLDTCLERRPPRVPVPEWAAAYDAETARLDALLQDFGDAEWHAPVRLRWFRSDESTSRRTTVAGVIAHLLSVDGLVGVALGLDDPLGDAPARRPTPAARTEAFWRASHFPPTRSVRAPWREQSHSLVRTVSFMGGGAERTPVSYGDFELPLPDAMLDRAFECWVHAEDIADAVDYPYDPPSPRHLHRMIDLAARMLPTALAQRRRAGLAAPAHHRHLVAAGEPGRSLRLEIEGSGGGEWLIPLDSPGAKGSAEHEVAHVALDGVEFCRLAAGHVPPQEAAAGQVGDKEAIRDVLFAAASLSRM